MYIYICIYIYIYIHTHIHLLKYSNKNARVCVHSGLHANKYVFAYTHV